MSVHTLSWLAWCLGAWAFSPGGAISRRAFWSLKTEETNNSCSYKRHPKVGHTAAKQPSASSDPPAVSLPPRCSQSLLNCCRGDSTCAYGGALDTRAASKSTAPLWARGVREGVRQLIGEERWWLLPRGRGRLKKTALAPGSAAVGSLSAAWEAQGKNGLTPGTNLGRRA